MSISLQTLNERIRFVQAVLQRKVDPQGLKPQAAIVADVTGAAPSGFGTRAPIAITDEALERLLGLDVIYASKVPNQLGGDKKSLALSVKLDAPPDKWLETVCRSNPEMRRLLNALHGLYALKAKLETMLGRPAEGELKQLVADKDKAQAALEEMMAVDAEVEAEAAKANQSADAKESAEENESSEEDTQS